jgi:hypothetical protein
MLNVNGAEQSKSCVKTSPTGCDYSKGSVCNMVMMSHYYQYHLRWPTTVSAEMADLKSTSYLIPLSAIEKWPAPNLTNPDRRTWLIPFTLILEVFATTTLMCRLWARVNRLAGGLRADDVSFVISTMSHTLSRELSIGGCQRSNVLREQSQRMQSI